MDGLVDLLCQVTLLIGSSEAKKLEHLFVDGAHCKFLVFKTALTMWASLLLKCCDAVLGKLKDNMSFDSFMELLNACLSGCSELFPRRSLGKAVEKSKAFFMTKQLGRL